MILGGVCAGLAGLVLASAAQAAIDYSVRIDAPVALSALLTDNLVLVTGKADPDLDEPLLAAMVRDTPEEAQRLAETAGYFSARVQVETPSPHQYVVRVDPGPQTLIRDVTIRLQGGIRSQDHFASRYRQMLSAWPLPIGAPFRQEDWDAGKRQMLRMLTTDTYPQARIAASEVRVDPVTARADLSLEVESGPPVAFGPLRIEGLSRYPASVVSGMADFQEGNDYRQQKLLDFQEALQQSAYFSSAIVSTDLAQLADNRLPVNVQLVEQPRQKLELGLLYDTLDGPGTRLGYEHYNLFGRGYTGSVLWDWKRTDQTVSAGLGLPRTADGYAHSLTGKWGVSDMLGKKTETLTTGVWRARQRGKIESRLGMEYLSERVSIASVPASQLHALIPTFGWVRRDVDNPLRPRDGSLLEGNVQATVGGVSSTTFVRGFARGVLYWSPWPRHLTVVTRGELGQVWAGDADSVPQSRLFQTGGAGSVRGYDTGSLGVTGPDGSTVGGRVLGVGSLELQFPVMPSWSLALFADAGNARESWQGFRLQKSHGVGLRWFNPIAPLSLDVARNQSSQTYNWHLSLGIAF